MFIFLIYKLWFSYQWIQVAFLSTALPLAFIVMKGDLLHMFSFCHLKGPLMILHYWNVNLGRLIKEFDRELKDQESRNPPEVNKQLNEKKQTMVVNLFLCSRIFL